MNALMQTVVASLASVLCLAKVPYISQMPEFPTGCESVSMAMVLNYEGYGVSPSEFVDGYLETTNDAYDGVFYDAFYGDPRSSRGMLCYPPVIKRATDGYLADIGATDKRCVDATGAEFEAVADEANSGNPAVIWITTNYRQPRLVTGKWGTYLTPNHAVVLTGVDYKRGKAYLNDPINGRLVKDLSLVKGLYDAKGRMAVYIEDVAKQTPEY